ncbi:putative serine/threonine protein kinase [Trichoderma pleuroticola]
MADPDVYAYLFPIEGEDQEDILDAISDPQNRLRYVGSEQGVIHILENRNFQHGQRKSTGEPKRREVLLDKPYIRLKFSDGAKTAHGVIMGWSPDCDIVLPRAKAVSGYHAALTFNENNHLVVRDLGSRFGTRVAYDEEKAQPGISMDWVVGGVDFVRDKMPILKITHKLQFQLIAVHHDIKSQQYIDNVAKFRQGTGDIADLAEFIKVRSYAATELPTSLEARTPFLKPSDPAYWSRVLGSGSFGIVTHVFNTWTGEEYALKEPKNTSKTGYRLEDWKKEVDIISNIQHDHIVTLLEAKFDPWPQLFFEYANGGPFSSYDATSDLEEIRYMQQLLSAMAAMHESSPPIVHRDIKPDNILCFFSPDGTMRVKFADFGLGKNTEQLKTFCGSLAYMAPEIYNKQKTKDESFYTPAVDVWSLAVVFAERQHGFPQSTSLDGGITTDWPEAVLGHYRGKSQEGSMIMPFIMDNMLHINPHARKTASYCEKQAVQLLGKQFRNWKLDGSKTSRSEDGDWCRSLIAELGYRGSSKIDSIVNPSDIDGDDDDSQTMFRLSCPLLPQPDFPAQVPAGQLVAPITESELWFTAQSDIIMPTIEEEAYKEGAMLDSLALSRRIRPLLDLYQTVDEGHGSEDSEKERSLKKRRLG